MVQNDVPCPKGSRQEKRVIEAPTPAPAPAPTNAAPAALAPIAPDATPAPATPAALAPAPPTAGATIAERLPPPDLYRCLTYKKESYLSETDLHAPRCVPLQTIGLDGNPGTGAGAACEMLRDSCERIADERLCKTWQQRLRDAEAALCRNSRCTA